MNRNMAGPRNNGNAAIHRQIKLIRRAPQRSMEKSEPSKAHSITGSSPQTFKPSDKQRALKEGFHNQIFPAGQRLKRSFLSPSSGTRAIESAPGIPLLRQAMGQ
ncbi:unnamed protein product [Arctogadus glacialis]